MSQYASMKLPAGGDQNKGPALQAVNLVSFCFAAIVVIARMCYRTLKIKQTAWDDYMILLSTVGAAVNTAFIVKYVENGGGRHAVYLGMQALEAKKYSTVAQIPFIISTTLTKTSIALMIIRISTSRKLKWSMAPLISIVIGVNFAGLIILTCGCKPFEGQWNYMITNRKCWPIKVMMNQNWVQGMVSIVSDFLYTLMPIFVVWGLNISRRQKIAISGLIGLGLVATGCSIVRMVLYATFNDWTDTTWSFSELQIWTALEQNLGIIAASLPTLRVFFKEIGQVILSSLQSLLGVSNTISPSGVGEKENNVQKRKRPDFLDAENGGSSQWSDSESGKGDKGSDMKAQSIEDMDLKYLGGDLSL